MTTITCKSCGQEIEITAALQGQIEAQVLAAEHKKHEIELERVKADANALIKKQLADERELLSRQAEADLDLAKKRLAAEAATQAKKAALDQELLIKSLTDDNQYNKQEASKLREQLTELMEQLRAERTAKNNIQLEANKRLAEEESKIREDAIKQADESQRLRLAEKDKQLEAAKKQVEEMQRKLNQGSQQMQGEILELDLEEALMTNFRDDTIEPVAKGVKGGDIKHTVKSPRGTVCGVMLWEIKRTKSWTDGWIPKLKEDLRSEKANIPIIVTEVMPKDATEDICTVNGVWICKPALAIVLGSLLRKSLLDSGLQKALAENRGTKADALYSFVTSHEFVQQVEAMIETYQDMTSLITKERTYYAKFWAEREAQARRLLLSTASIVGSMQGHIGQGSMPRIRGLEFAEIDSDVETIQ